MARYYFADWDDLGCHTLDTHLDHMEKYGVSKMDVYEAKAEFGSGYFFCQEYGVVGEQDGMTCGKICDKYKPRNGKNGRCVHNGYCYERTDKKRTLELIII